MYEVIFYEFKIGSNILNSPQSDCKILDLLFISEDATRCIKEEVSKLQE